MGRAPCCDKANVKRGPWSPDEDAKLKSYIDTNGTGNNWIALPQKIGLKRCGKSCRLRWLNYLRPNIRHGSFSEEEDNIICSLYMNIGSRWSIIAAQLPGRTDNDIKNYWNTRLKKKLLGKQRKEQQAARHRANHHHAIKRESDNFNMIMMPSPAAAAAMNQLYPSYWPADLPLNVAMSVGQEPHHIKDQESIKSLLINIKLGGKFSNEEQTLYNPTNLQYPNFDIISSSLIAHQAQLFDQKSITHMPNTPYVVQGDHEFNNNIQEFSWTVDQLNELLYSTTSTQIDQYEGMGSFSGVDNMVNGSSGTSTSAESTSWGDQMSSFVTPPPPTMMTVTVNDDGYVNSKQGFLQDSAFEEPRYCGLIQ